jgi:hypothetical protein
MSADLHIHIVTDNLTEEHFKCFFSHSMGSKWFDWGDYECEYEIARRDDYDQTLKTFQAAYPEWRNKALVGAPAEVSKYWGSLLNDHYERVGFTCQHHKDIDNTPNIWVGEVSWLKAALFEEGKEDGAPSDFIPDPIGKISELIGEDMPVITDEFIEKVRLAMSVPNQTQYSLAKAQDILSFLKTYKGKSCFTVSW